MQVRRKSGLTFSIFVIAISCSGLLLIREIFNPHARRYINSVRINQQFLNSWSVQHLNRVVFPLTDMLEELQAAGYKVTLKSNVTRPPSYLLSHISKNLDKASSTTSLPPFVVPNVVHYVWLGSDLEFTLIQYLSFRSVSRHIKPDYIFVHGEVGPSGKWWNTALNEIRNVYHVYEIAPKNAYSGNRFRYAAHESDLLRTEIVYKFGGIYLDADVIVVKSFDPLRRFNTTMGRERSDGICNGIIVSRKGAPFIRLLLDQYESYSVSYEEEWAYRSVVVPHTLAQVFPSWIHVEETTLNRPSFRELDLIYDKVWDWSKNYAIHTWIRVREKVFRLPQTLNYINCDRSTLAEIGRLALYGSAVENC